MHIESILITASAAFTLKEIIEKEHPNIQVLTLDENAKELPITDAYIGFTPLLNFYDIEYKWVHALSAGVDAFVGNGKFNKNTILTRTIDQFGYQIGSYCLSYMLNITNKVYEFQEFQRQKHWHKLSKDSLENEKVVIFGTGEIGSEIARILDFMEMDVYGISRSGKQVPYFKQVYSIDKKDEALKNAKWVINILPLTPETQQLFDINIFKQLKNANFINVGRGKSVIEKDLVKALELGYINYAILDVFEIEPLPLDSPLWNHKRVIVTPHISGMPNIAKSLQRVPLILNDILNDKELKAQVDLTKNY